MRILHVSTWDVPCGIATYCANLVQALDRLGIRGDVYPLAAHRWLTFTAGDVTELLADIAAQARHYDLVHVQHEHGLFGHAVSYKAASHNFGTLLRLLRAANRPVATTFHTAPLAAEGHGPLLSLRTGLAELLRTWGRRFAWRRHVSAAFAAPASGAIAIAHTPATRRALIRQGIPSAAVHVIEHGCLPPCDLRLDPLSAKDRLGLPPGGVLLTMFGFVGGYKGHDLAVRALARLPDRFHLAICGGTHPESQDDALATVVRLVRRLGLEQRVTVTGWLAEETASLYAAATDICLAPYRDATLSASGAITWALASGKPTIASKIPAFQAIAREQPCLLLTSPGVVEELVWAARKLAEDEDLAARLVAAARRYTAAHSWDATARRTHDLYASLIAGDPAAAPGLGRSRIVSRDGCQQPRRSAADHAQRPRRRTAG